MWVGCGGVVVGIVCNVKQVAHGHPRWGKGCGVLGESAHRSVKLTHAPRGYAFRPKGHLQPPSLNTSLKGQTNLQGRRWPARSAMHARGWTGAAA
jgi:hypothetical protein